MHLGSRRQLRLERGIECFEEDLKRLSGQSDIDTVSDLDTLAYYAERVPLDECEKLLLAMSTSMIRMKALDAFRLYGYFTIAIDGSQIATFNEAPWSGCPHRKLANGDIQYVAYVLDAKLGTPCGLTLSLASEMLINEGNETFDKQDCEQKAFPCLVEKLYGMFPRTPLCLLLDGLYANQNVMRLIEKNRWKYIITFKESSMPERFDEALSLARLQKTNHHRPHSSPYDSGS